MLSKIEEQEVELEINKIVTSLRNIYQESELCGKIVYMNMPCSSDLYYLDTFTSPWGGAGILRVVSDHYSEQLYAAFFLGDGYAKEEEVSELLESFSYTCWLAYLKNHSSVKAIEVRYPEKKFSSDLVFLQKQDKQSLDIIYDAFGSLRTVEKYKEDVNVQNLYTTELVELN